MVSVAMEMWVIYLKTIHYLIINEMSKWMRNTDIRCWKVVDEEAVILCIQTFQFIYINYNTDGDFLMKKKRMKFKCNEVSVFTFQ